MTSDDVSKAVAGSVASHKGDVSTEEADNLLRSSKKVKRSAVYVPGSDRLDVEMETRDVSGHKCSYKDSLTGSRHGMFDTGEVHSEVVFEDDSDPKDLDDPNFPTIYLTTMDKQCIRRVWANTLIFKVLGRWNKLGKTMQVDESTEASSRAKFTLGQYEGLHLVCFGCGTYGHRQDHCLHESPVVVEPSNCEDPPIESVVAPAPTECPPSRPEIVENYGAWMLVQRTKCGRPCTSASRGYPTARGGPVNDGSETVEAATAGGLPDIDKNLQGSRFHMLENQCPILDHNPADGVSLSRAPGLQQPYSQHEVNARKGSRSPLAPPAGVPRLAHLSIPLPSISIALPPEPGCEVIQLSYPPEPPELTMAEARIGPASHCGDEMVSCTVPVTPMGLEHATLEAVDAVVIAEPKISGSHATQVTRQLGFTNVFRMDAQGFSGGLWLLWTVTVLDSGCGFIHLQISRNNGSVWFCTFVYVNPAPILKAELFQRLAAMAVSMSRLWLITGDFNEMLGPEEKVGGAGPKFTWRGRESSNSGRVFEWLDRASGNLTWCARFPSTSIRHLPRVRSNHHPLLVCTESLRSRPDGALSFRFEITWTTHPAYLRLLLTHWDNTEALPHMLLQWRDRLQDWNREVFSNIFRQKRRVLSRLGGVQRALMVRPNRFLRSLEAELQAKYRLVSRQETLHWFQKSQMDWLCMGNRNTRFFHASTAVRHRRNRIEAVRDDSGQWVFDSVAIQN
ncbi:hypothetical protein K2173_007022 [Erythroxylum novogranatense]|uniref:CCHC-type domain-containing protein n=1 Tax=Erythroxylum novogranatense TaxID=1862640 RepID=A0AAV8SKG7_9ROSI|nr:hypothetical protein K2173_007022 [Erythroxylum novogranatense]